MPDIEKIPWDELLDNKQTAYILGTIPQIISNYKGRKRIPKKPTLYQIVNYIIKGRKDPEEKLASLNRLEKYTFRKFETIEEAKDYYTPIIVYLGRSRNPSSVGNQIFLIERLSNEEIAEILGLQTGSVGNSIHKGVLKSGCRKDVTKRLFEPRGKSNEEILSKLNELYQDIEEFSNLGEAYAVLTGVYNLELNEPEVIEKTETTLPVIVKEEPEKPIQMTKPKKPEKRVHRKLFLKEPKKSSKKETYLNEEIGAKEMLEMGFTNSEIVEAFRDDSGLKKKGDGKTTRRFLTPYIVIEYVTDDEYRRFELISELYEKDLKEGLEEDEEVESTIVAIKFIKEKYNLDLPIPDELEEPEPETEPEKFELEDVREMMGNDVAFEHLLNYLEFKTDEGLVNRDGLEVYAIISNCDDWPLGERQEFLNEIGVEGNIVEISDKLGKTLYKPKPEEDENDIPEADPEHDIYNLKQISDALESDVFEHFKTMFGYKLDSDSFTLNNIAKFGVESEYDDFSLKDRDDFLEDFGLEGGVEQVAEMFGLTPYILKEPAKEPEKKKKEKPHKPKESGFSLYEHEFVPNDRSIPPKEKYSLHFRCENMLISTEEWFSRKFGDMGEKLRQELYEYCKKEGNENLLSIRGGSFYITARNLYSFFHDVRPKLVFGTYNGDCFWNFFRGSSTPD